MAAPTRQKVIEYKFTVKEKDLDVLGKYIDARSKGKECELSFIHDLSTKKRTYVTDKIPEKVNTNEH